MSDSQLTESEHAMITEEERLLGHVQTELKAARHRHSTSAHFDDELMALRDQLADARAEDHAALVEHMTRLAALRAVQDREREEMADPNSPYFARLELVDKHEGKDRVRDVLVGRRAHIDTARGVRIVDWRNSPISRIYYCYNQGDEYEERFAGILQSGTLSRRRTLTINGGHLRRIVEADTVLLRDEAAWRRAGTNQSQLSGGVGTATRAPTERLGRVGEDQRLPEITALIDPAQFRIITDPSSGVVVIRGGAGTGKTTIALHRVAFLHFQDKRRFSAKRLLVITPGDALRRYVGMVLPALDVNGVPISTFADWALNTVKRLVPALRRRKLTDEAPSGAQRLKRHPALLGMLERAVRDEARTFDDAMEAIGLLDAWVRRRNLPSMSRIAGVRKWLKSAQGRATVGDQFKVAERTLDDAGAELNDPFETWADLMTDRQRLATEFKAAKVEHYEWELDQLVETVTRQAEEPEGPGEVDHAFRTGIDGRSLYDSELQGRLDADDLAAILRVCELKYGELCGPTGQRARYEHVVVDEAQDLAPLCIQVLCGAVKPGGPVTLAGDTAQRLSLDTGFGDWDDLLKVLRLKKANVLPPLAISYRSTQQVMSLSRYVLGDLVHDEPDRDARSGAPVQHHHFDETGEAVAFLADALKSLLNRERRATVALVSRSPAVADIYYNGLRRAEVPAMRRIRSQEFDFTPGIDVTDVFQIKGLEYDYIVMLETSAASYGADAGSRHLFHVAATRAAHQLWLVSSQRPSPLLPPELANGGTWPPEEA